MTMPDLWQDPLFSKKVLLVGGAVRDKLLGKEPKDRDWVIVGASKEDVARMFAMGYEQVGADFPVFLHPETREEYALARVERKAGVGYHGFEVDTEGVTIEMDLARRDLTVNSMAMDHNGNLIDPFNGVSDLHNGVLRHTTDAFAEDPLRVLRVARFAARWNWQVHHGTIALCRKLTEAGELNNLSIERIWLELDKGLQGANPARFWGVLEEVGAIRHCAVLADLFPSGLQPFTNHVATALKCVPAEGRLAVGVSTAAALNASLPGAALRVKNAHRNAADLLVLDHTASEILELLRRSRGLQGGQTFNDLVWCAQVYEAAGYKLIKARHLLAAAAAARAIRGSDFDLPEGRELGEKIKSAQISAIQQTLNIPR